MWFDVNVKEEIQNTPKSKLLKLEFHDNTRSKFQFEPGQYITIEIEIDSKKYYRDYSICSSIEENKITICIKETITGFVSKYICNNNFKNTKLRISEAKGNFTLKIKPKEKRTILAFSAGSGITPIYSIIQNLLKEEKGIQLYLFYGNSNPKNTIFLEEINELKKQYSNQFFPHYFYTQKEVDNPIFKGRINTKKLKLIINQIVEWDEVDEILICGPKEMSVELYYSIQELGIPKQHIHLELFEALQISEKKANIPKIREIKVKITLAHKNYEIIWKPNGSSLLDSLLEKEIPIPYSCRGGVCGSCVCEIEEGKANLGEQLVLLDSELENGQFLPCACFSSESDKLSINFDTILK